MGHRRHLSGMSRTSRNVAAMVDLKYFLFQMWEWIVNHGIPLTALLLCAILLPRLGRLVIRIIARRFSKGEEATKTRLALIGALVYVVQAIGYFIIIMLALTNLGVPPVGAALPTTVLTAAIGFGSQKIIGDFLAGFFIISERQFGVGDFVSFDGTTGDISGTVVALTLRATKVRTPSGELVTVPNGSAGVITNYSQEWSRAVVNLAIPLQPGESMDDLIRTVETTVHRALKDPSIAHDVRGQIEILPATEIIAPVAAGQPWAVNFRINAEVNPAMQWAVERVVRSALLNAFWDRYDLPGSSAGVLPSRAGYSSASPIASSTDATTVPTEAFPAATASAEELSGRHAASPQKSAPTETFGATGVHNTNITASGTSNTGIPGTGTSNASIAASGTTTSTTDDTGTKLIPEANSPEDDSPAAAAPIAPSDHGPGKGLDADRIEDEDLEGLVPQRQIYDTKIKNALSLGGRIRWSTTALVIALIVVGLLAIFSSNPEGGNAGVLSPDKWRTTKSAPAEATHPEPSPEQSQNPTTSEGEESGNSTEPSQGPSGNPNQPTNTDQGTDHNNDGGSTPTTTQPRSNNAPQQGNQRMGNSNTGNNPGTENNSRSGNNSGNTNGTDSADDSQDGAAGNPSSAAR